ncbi:uncharacterized protein LOC111711694 [Eurytemora carolleeae]|uniref:uncharacterized protein LOC111711694 n=1 Tax=Eurytemora carolleeae TaxID=1294199 RepID=UPI000C789BA5|nr:uncharacterized protein LOC111711694 [Eurytemora carolleeae]|eukprot:XP_023341867.1 uncharacterized protein LOC111711694 [Eurytemora affinis]
MKPKLIGRADFRFRGSISLNSPVTLSKEDYGSILTSIIIKESNLDWDGNISNSSSTILNLLEGFARFENDAERSLFRAVSFIQAFNSSRFPQSLLREHLEIVSQNLQSTSPYLPAILRYIDISSHILQGMQNHSAEMVGEVVGNLAVLDQEKVKPKAEYSIRIHAERMLKDWWKELSEELIPDSIPDRFILVEQKPDLNLEQEEEDTELDPVQIKRRRSNLEIITEMLNHKIAEAGVKYAAFLEKLEINLLNYYAENIENACKTYLWSRSKVNEFISSLPQHQICV